MAREHNTRPERKIDQSGVISIEHCFSGCDGELHVARELKFFGDYELLEVIGRGRMAVVYKAQHPRAEHVVALKTILDEALASEADVIRFYNEVLAASALEHPNIVPICHVGEKDGHHYFTMKWMRGGSLADRMKEYRGDCRRVAELIVVIAQAVHYGHQRGILHRELRPASILLDNDGKPHVADFGLTMIGNQNTSYALSGTSLYMAPEHGGDNPLTVTADVYSLGVILYELLTGWTPFLVKLVEEGVAQDPRTIEPGIDMDLATICLRCLKSKPENRYGSAEALTRDLKRYLDDEPILTAGRPQRAWRWCKRKPLLAALIVEATLLLMVATIAVFSGAAAQEKDRTEEILHGNEYAARWIAGTVVFKLNGYHDAMANAAREFPPGLIATLRQDVKPHPDDEMQHHCRHLVERHGSSVEQMPLNSCFIVDKEGRGRAIWPPLQLPTEEYIKKNFGWRDYFKGAWKLAANRTRAAHISRAVLSEATSTWRFVISAPIYDERGEPVGLIATAADAGPTLGTLALNDPSDNRHIAMVVAPNDNDRDTRDHPLPQDHIILVHNSLAAGTTKIVKSNASIHKALALAESRDSSRQLEQLLLPEPHAVLSDESFCDPVMDGICQDESGKTRPGRWLAGLAPIGNTGFVAIVETPRDAAARPNQILANRLLLWGVLPFFLGTALVAAVVRVVQRALKQSNVDIEHSTKDA